MPILKRTSFTSKSNAKASLKYLYFGRNHKINTPKHQNKSNQRNLVIDGRGINPISYLAVFNSMSYFFNHNHGKRGLLNLVMSFPKSDFPKDSFDEANSKWALVIDKLAKNFAAKAFPNHQFIIAVQDDGANHNPHAHIFVNLVSISDRTRFGSLRSLSGSNYNAFRLTKLADQVTANFNKVHHTNLTVSPSSKALTKTQAKIYQIISKAIPKSSSIKNFKHRLQAQGIRPNFTHYNSKPGLSFDYFSNENISPGYCNHVKASTLADKTGNQLLKVTNLLYYFQLKKKFAKVLKANAGSNSNYINQLKKVVALTPSKLQKQEAKAKIKVITNKIKQKQIIKNIIHYNSGPQL